MRRGSRFDNALLVTQQLRIGLDFGDYATDIGGFLRRHAAMFVELDRVSVTRRTRIDALRVGQIDRTDRDHLHRGSLRRRAGHHDHGGDPPEARKRKAFDHLLVGDDFVSSRCELSVDPLDAEGMPEMNRFPSRARGHAGSPANLRAKS